MDEWIYGSITQLDGGWIVGCLVVVVPGWSINPVERQLQRQHPSAV